MAGFIQIMEFTTSRIDDVEALSEEMRAERGEALLATKATIAADRDQPGRYLAIVEFESFEAAMKNSADEVTGKYAEKMNALLDGPPTFVNLDVRLVTDLSRR